MSKRTRIVIVLGVVALGTLVWRWQSEHASPDGNSGASLEPMGEADLEPAAAGPMVGVVAPTADETPVCLPESDTGPSFSEADWEARMDSSRKSLMASGNPEHMAAAALMAQPEARVALVTPAWSGSSNPVVASIAARICARAPAEAGCPADTLAEHLLVVDPLNSESWMFAASRRFMRGDEAGALAAVQRAAVATESRTYWAETIALVERALAATTDLPFPARANAAFGVAAGNLPNTGFSKMCADRSQASQTWARACLAYGELAERHADTIMSESIARGVQISALNHLAEPQKLAEVNMRRDRASQELASAAAIHFMDELVLTSPAWFADYLTVAAQQGESAALRWKRTEAARLRAELPPCAAR